MKKCLLLASILVIITQLAVADDRDEKILREIKTELWQSAYRNQDTVLLGNILHPKFQMINAQGNITTRDDELKWVKNNAWNPSNFKYQVERLEIYQDNFAIVSGTGTTDTYKYKSSNMFVKENGQWRAIASHVSGYTENIDNK